MDYSVGSLSDLITGSNTPNKPKVIKTEVSVKAEINLNESQTDEKLTSRHKSKKGKKRKLDDSTITTSVVTAESEEPTNTRPTRQEQRERTKKLKREKDKLTWRDNPEELARTIFVGNVPLSAKKQHLKQFFGKYGVVETVRFRGTPVKDLKTTKKVAVIKGEFHPDRRSCIAYVRFATAEEAKHATSANGLTFKDHHIRVALSDTQDKHDESKAIFIGNLSFKAEDEELWKTFEPCGKIEGIRVVRDNRTGMCKGFAFVNFAHADSVQLALELEKVKIDNKELRISVCNTKAAKKNQKSDKAKTIKSPGKAKQKKMNRGKHQSYDEGGSPEKNAKTQEELVETEKSDHKSSEDANIVQDAEFQGSKISLKKKKKKNMGLVQKKKLIKKIAPRV